MLQGHLDSLLLAVIEDEPAHGYAIIDELRRRSRGAFDLPEGTVYPALHRLERAGLLRSDTTVVSGRQRRVYRLSRRGASALRKERAEWRDFSGAVSAVLKVARA
jgi:DNA-binding PadR family transcriptional regulator